MMPFFDLVLMLDIDGEKIFTQMPVSMRWLTEETGLARLRKVSQENFRST
jgi:hypothetical protein